MIHKDSLRNKAARSETKEIRIATNLGVVACKEVSNPKSGRRFHFYLNDKKVPFSSIKNAEAA